MTVFAAATSSGLAGREQLAHQVAAALTGSTAFLIIAAGVVIGVMRPARLAAATQPAPRPHLLHQES